MKRTSRIASFLSLCVVLGLAVVIFASAGPGRGEEAEASTAASAEAAGAKGGTNFIPPLPCGEMFQGQVVHMDKIIFRSSGTVTIVCPPGTIDPANAAPFLIKNFSVMDIKVLDNPNLIADVQGKTADFLNTLGCVNGAGTPVRAAQVDVIDVEYAVACGLGPK